MVSIGISILWDAQAIYQVNHYACKKEEKEHHDDVEKPTMMTMMMMMINDTIYEKFYII